MDDSYTNLQRKGVHSVSGTVDDTYEQIGLSVQPTEKRPMQSATTTTVKVVLGVLGVVVMVALVVAVVGVAMNQQHISKWRQSSEPLRNMTLAERMAALEVDLQRLEYRSQLQTAQDPTDSGTPTLGRTPCVLGSNYRFREFPGRYGEGVPLVQSGVTTGHGCLDACRRYPGCVAASVSSGSSPTCHIYTQLPTRVSRTDGWNYYVMAHTSSCDVEKPVIEFQAALCTTKNFGADQRVMWDTVVTNLGDGFHESDGAFHCPVQGVYAFTVNIISNPTGCTSYARFHLKDENGKSVAELFSSTCAYTTSTNTVYRECRPGQTIHLHSMKANNALFGECSNKYNTNFSGRLVALL